MQEDSSQLLIYFAFIYNFSSCSDDPAEHVHRGLGCGAITYFNSVEVFSSVNQTWAALPNMTTRRGWCPAAGIVNKSVLIVCGGGYDAARILNSCERFDLTNVTAGWRLIANMSVPRAYSSGSLLHDNNTFLLCGGWNRASVSGSSCEKLDIASNSWSSVANLSLGVRALHRSILFNNKAIVIGGGNASGSYLNTCEQYDAMSNTWSIFPPLLGARNDFGAAVVLGKIYVAGGGFNGLSLRSVEVFDGTAWVLLPYSLPQFRSACSGVEFQNKFVVLGGDRTTVEVFDPLTSRWNSSFVPAMSIAPTRDRFVAVSF
jgi:hypothetical protein